MKNTVIHTGVLIAVVILFNPSFSFAWNDETHLAVSKAAGYKKWYNSAGADLAKIKAGDLEGNNHYHNNPRGTVVTPAMVISQAERYNTLDRDGHLYGAIIASVRSYREDVKGGKYGEYHLSFCAHYVADLSQPLHNTPYNPFNKENHKAVDQMVNGEALAKLDKIIIYPITIESERDLAREVARIANLSLKLGFRMEDEGRIPTKAEAYRQLGHSASLLRAILNYVKP